MPSAKYAFALSSLRFSNGRTAILFSGGLNCAARETSPRNIQIAAAPITRPTTPAPTSLGYRRDQRQIRVGADTCAFTRGTLWSSLSFFTSVNGRYTASGVSAFAMSHLGPGSDRKIDRRQQHE